MKTPVLSIAPGKVINFHGEPCIVLEHRTDGTLLITAAQIEHNFGKDNDFASSDLFHHLNGTWLEALTENHPEEVLVRTVDLTAVNGSKQYGTCQCKVAPLTLDEIRKYHEILPKPESWEWSATPWSTPSVDEDDTWVCGLHTNGNVNYYYCSNSNGSRPAFLIASSYTVEDDSNPLAQFTTQELAEELCRRVTAGKD